MNIIFSLLVCSKCFLIFIMISHLIHGLYNNCCLISKYLGILFVMSSLLISSLIFIWSENVIWLILVPENCSGLLKESALSILVNILYAFGKNVYSAILSTMEYANEMKFVNCGSHIYHYWLSCESVNYWEKYTSMFMDLLFKVFHSYYIALQKNLNQFLWLYEYPVFHTLTITGC